MNPNAKLYYVRVIQNLKTDIELVEAELVAGATPSTDLLGTLRVNSNVADSQMLDMIKELSELQARAKKHLK